MISFEDLTPEVIAAACNIDTLHDWHDMAYAEYDQQLAELDALRDSGTLTNSYLRRTQHRLTIMSCIKRRVERRVIELGQPPILTRHGVERDMIKHLRAEQCELKAVIRELRKENEDLRCQIAQVERLAA